LNAHGIFVYELLGKIVRDAMNATLQAFVACCLAGLHKAFDLVLLAFRT
jgi:hypothetical protein